MHRLNGVAAVFVLTATLPSTLVAQERPAGIVDATTIHGKTMCGYQGWFRCPGDGAGQGWVHWSRDSQSLSPKTLTFEMWPDVSEYPQRLRYAAPGFTYPDGQAAQLFSSYDAAAVQLHFDWMRTYGIDGAWLQHFLVDLPGGRFPSGYPSRMRVLNRVAESARRTGRAWALSYDIAGQPLNTIFNVLTADWKRMVEQKIVLEPCYLHERDRPVVQIWGFYWNNSDNLLTAELAARLIDFFKARGPYSAFLVGGGDWDWRRNSDPHWREQVRRLDAYAPWNVGNFEKDSAGRIHASTAAWLDDKRDCDARGQMWLPVVYPGFSWDNLKRRPAGSSAIPRRRGRFLWEQFHTLARMKVDSAYVAMFDEVDEGTAIFKVTSTPPTQAHFVGYEGMPSDWYLRLVGVGAAMLSGRRPLIAEIPIKP